MDPVNILNGPGLGPFNISNVPCGLAEGANPPDIKRGLTYWLAGLLAGWLACCQASWLAGRAQRVDPFQILSGPGEWIAQHVE